MRIAALLLCLTLSAAVASAQNQPAGAAHGTPSAAEAAHSDPLSTYNRQVFAGMKNILIQSAEKMPEDSYGFKPVDTVRSYGQIIGHVADAQYLFCSVVIGEPNPAPKVEQTKTSKADLIAALKTAFAYCDKAYDGMTDASASQTVKFMGNDAPKLGVLSVNNAHVAEHYGNLVTYMRMKNIIPPSTEQRMHRQQQPKQ